MREYNKNITFKPKESTKQAIDKILELFNSKSNLKIKQSNFIRVCLKKICKEIENKELSFPELILKDIKEISEDKLYREDVTFRVNSLKLVIDKILKLFNLKSNIKITQSDFVRVCLEKVCKEIKDNKISSSELIFDGLINPKMEKF